MTPERIAELRRLHEAATPGPWEFEDRVGAGLELRASVHLSEGVELPSGMPARPIRVIEGAGPQKCLLAYERWVQFEPTGWSEMQARNFAFITASRAAVPELLSEIERLQSAIQDARRACLALKEHVSADHCNQEWLSGMWGDILDDYLNEVPRLEPDPPTRG